MLSWPLHLLYFLNQIWVTKSCWFWYSSFKVFFFFKHYICSNTSKVKKQRETYNKKSLTRILPHLYISQTPTIVYQYYWFLIFFWGFKKNTALYKSIYPTPFLLLPQHMFYTNAGNFNCFAFYFPHLTVHPGDLQYQYIKCYKCALSLCTAAVFILFMNYDLTSPVMYIVRLLLVFAIIKILHEQPCTPIILCICRHVCRFIS